MSKGDLALKAHIEELKHLRQIIAGFNKAILVLSMSDAYRDKVEVRAGDQHTQHHDAADRTV